MLTGGPLQQALLALPQVSQEGPWCRMVPFHLLQGPPPGAQAGSAPQPLWPGGAPLTGGRYTPKGGFDTIYLAVDPHTAAMEVSAVVNPRGTPQTLRTPPQVLLTVDGYLAGLIDLCDLAIQHQLGTSRQELTGNWVRAQSETALVATQELGLTAHATNTICGLIAPSAKNPDGSNLVVFAGRLALHLENRLNVYDPHGNLAQSLP